MDFQDLQDEMIHVVGAFMQKNKCPFLLRFMIDADEKDISPITNALVEGAAPRLEYFEVWYHRRNLPLIQLGRAIEKGAIAYLKNLFLTSPSFDGSNMEAFMQLCRQVSIDAESLKR